MIVRPTVPARLVAGLLVAALASAAPQLWAERGDRPGLLLGGGAGPAEALPTVDPLLPTGARIHSLPRPEIASSICGLVHPVCVHHGVEPSRALAPSYLGALEDAYSLLVAATGLPAPSGDLGLGPTSGLDLYLVPDATHGLDVVPDPRSPYADRGSAHCRARPSRDELRHQAGRCVGEAVLIGLDGAETPHLRQAIASYLSQLVVPTSSPAQLAAIDTLQANPQLGLAGRDVTLASPGAALFFHHLDERLGAGRRGVLPAALVQLSRSRTPAGRPEWHNEPDAIDVLRHAFERSEQRFDDFVLSFAVERAFLGSRDNGRHHPELFWLRDAGRVRFDWVMTTSSLPRRVAPRRPLEPLGTAYLWLEIDRVTLDKTLAFRAEWEAPATFRWTVAAVAADGNILKRYDLPYVQNATAAERSLVDHDGATGLLIVGVNLGGVDLAHPFDPDHEPAEPHGFTVYLTEI